ncbi:TIM-barrel domain-containing protein [Plebeiibacterium sediminum]|uniref:DUF4968 domain-containing protein n=1 Tax=Plebeiibacterium sediminum TaxID=2992112 RepID=A0AAE3M7R0_9BACT|nr:TIM-barrel domain-containing protein [Plebeiobacterium sediminum]MCW3788557.1 DUF4968 domain-containing protein [Plebeiobacterium sediminum]
MYRNLRFFVVLLSTTIVVLYGCTCNPEGRYVKDIHEFENGINIETNDANIHLTALSDHSIEVNYLPMGYEAAPSYALEKHLGKVETHLENKSDHILFSTNNLNVHIQKCPLAISYFYKDSLLFKEEQGLLFNDSIKGFRMQLDPDEKLMGGGERVLGMDRRGNRLRLYNRASYGYETHADLMYYSLPIVISSNKYMLLFDNVADGWMDLGKTEKDILQFETKGGRLSYVVVGGEDYPSLTENYTQVTGHQPMPPRWALGNISSRMGYKSQKEVEEVVSTYQKQQIPLDGIVLDLFWFGPDVKGYMGNLEWDKQAFPEPEKMMSGLKNKGVKTVLITEPFILKNTGKYDECIEQQLLGTDSLGQPFVYDFYFGTTTLLDIFKPETQEWFWDIYKKHTLSGVEGWWGDLGEPELHPSELHHVNGKADLVHNAYGHEWARTIFNGFTNDFPKKRPVILMRSGFAGSQRYGMIPWSGDVSRTWGGLKPQVEISLQMGLQGLAYMHSDLGGFAGDYKDAELYTRWLQYGVFQPVFRTHAQSDVPPEPIYWDKKTKSIAREFIKLRYRLTPYLYTMVYENATKGIPLMRPLFYASGDTSLISNKANYLWGDNFLVSPITEKGAQNWNVTLPEGSNWYHFFTEQKYSGGQVVEVSVTINEIPVFVKGGAFIPMVKAFSNMEAYYTKDLTLHYYYDADAEKSKGYMYDDDGKTNNSWINHLYEKLFFESENDDQKISIKVTRESNEYDGKPEDRNISFVIHNVVQKPKRVLVNDDSVRYIYNQKEHKLLVTGVMYGDKEINMTIRK